MSLFAPEARREATEIWVPLFQKLKSVPNVQLIQYYFPDFAEDDNHHHKRFFGTVVRFMAAFDRSVKRMFSWDVDSKITPELKKMIDSWIRSDENFLLPAFFDYKPAWSNKIIGKKVPFFFLAGYWGAKRQGNNVLLGKLFGALLGYDSKTQVIVRENLQDPFAFGIDEILLNNILIPVFYHSGALVCSADFSCDSVVPRHDVLLTIRCKIVSICLGSYSDQYSQYSRQVTVGQQEKVLANANKIDLECPYYCGQVRLVLNRRESRKLSDLEQCNDILKAVCGISKSYDDFMSDLPTIHLEPLPKDAKLINFFRDKIIVVCVGLVRPSSLKEVSGQKKRKRNVQGFTSTKKGRFELD